MKSKLAATTEDAFAVGKAEGLREAFQEISEMTKTDNMANLRVYLKARIKSLTGTKINNPFGRKP